MEEQGMPVRGGRVITALSGGADSVCLLTVLHRIRESDDLNLRAVHVHHGLRGEEADRDVRFVQALCNRLEIPLTVVYRDVAAYAADHGFSTEEAGRVLRYEAFALEARRWAAEAAVQEEDIYLALAHHKDDHAETILHHLLRGSGLKGLSGIRPVQGTRIRPLLCVNRAEILEYLKAEGIAWCEDSTNKSDDYTRNRIRNQLIPQMKEQINPRAVENIVRAGEIFAQADGYLERQAQLVWQKEGSVCENSKDAAWSLERGAASAGNAEHEQIQQEAVSCSRISLTAFRAQEPIIQTYIVRHMLDLVTPGWKDITFGHFQDIADLTGKQVGKRLDLPCGMQAVCDYEYLMIVRRKREPDVSPATAGELKMRIFSRKKGEEIPKNRYTKWFDYDKIKNTLFLRTRQTGDYLMLPGGGRKAVTRYMIDEKIPREERESIPVLAEGSHVLWVVGFRISEYYKVTNTTKTILEAEYDGGKEDGREHSCITV